MLSMSHKTNLLILPAMVLPNRAWVFTMQASLPEKAYEQSSIHLKNQSKRALASPMLLARQETATVSQLESAREQQFRREASGWNIELLLDGLGCSVVLNSYVWDLPLPI